MADSTDRVVLTKNIRTQLLASHLPSSGPLDSGPILCIKENPAFEPIGNVLLADLFQAKGAQLRCQGGMSTASNADGFLQSDNVRFIHRHPKYTNRFVHVNQPVCVTANKEVCSVLSMVGKEKTAALRRPLKPGSVKTPKRVAKQGPDGKTLGQRVLEAMAYKSGRIGQEYRQVDLLRDANFHAGAGMNDPVISQQMLSAIIVGGASQSSMTVYLAQACGVNPVWMSRGVGKMIP